MSIPVGIKIHMMIYTCRATLLSSYPLADGSYGLDLSGRLNQLAGLSCSFGLSGFSGSFGLFSSTSWSCSTEQTRQTEQTR